MAARVLRDFGGIRRSLILEADFRDNPKWLDNGGWARLLTTLDGLRNADSVLIDIPVSSTPQFSQVLTAENGPRNI